MKCIRCQHDCKYPERKNRRCPQCKGEFAFEPRTGDRLTDMMFLHAIEHVSSKGHVRWGVEHLYYEICRRLRWKGLGAFLVRLFFVDTKLVRLQRTNFESMWKRWVKVHGSPAGVIVRREGETPTPSKLEADIGDYSFDRAVICDRARTVDVLLANNFHFENNCAILSVDGYPPGPFATVRAMLKRNPRLQVFALHDATQEGCSLATRLARDPAWFGGSIPVVDVGLRPNHSRPFHGLWLSASSRVVQAQDGITAAEALWLSKYQLELAVIRPEQVLKRLFRALNRQFDPNEPTDAPAGDAVSGDGGVVWSDSSSFGTDAADADGGGDSFG